MIATLREGRYGVNSVFKGKNTDFNENRGPRRQSATRDNMMSSYSCSVMMMMMESWSRGP
jgi:hypothetical protein